ncbi:acyl carrier protein [Paenibacillus sp. FSL H8-0122]|uniref:acyl carrier protein n=1 Tax=Paenibacillus sp. FSL H8-0122 TaxID=2954510 RepID=UPI0030F60BA1
MTLKEIVADILAIPDQETIHEDLSPQNAPEWTSLKHIKLITTIEDTYKVKFTFKEVKSLKNLAAFITVLKSKGVSNGIFE